MAQRPLKRRLHLHVAELADGEVEVVEGFGALRRGSARGAAWRVRVG
jgi:hypothetical protein